MKVIKPGRKQKGPAFKRTCTGEGNGAGGCGAVLLVEAGDTYETSRSCMGEVDTFATFTCAQCGTETDFEDNPHGLPTKAEWLKKKVDPIIEEGAVRSGPTLSIDDKRIVWPVKFVVDGSTRSREKITPFRLHECWNKGEYQVTLRAKKKTNGRSGR